MANSTSGPAEVARCAAGAGRSRRSTLSAALILAALLCVQGAHARSPAAGLYVLYSVLAPRLDPGVVARPYVSGLALQIGWRDVEPRSGQYDWSRIDETLLAAQAAGKRVTIHLLPLAPPDWV